MFGYQHFFQTRNFVRLWILFTPNFLQTKYFLHQNFVQSKKISDQFFCLIWSLIRQPQNDQTNPYLLNQTWQTKPIKPKIPGLPTLNSRWGVIRDKINLVLKAELQKGGILESRIPDIFWRKPRHFQINIHKIFL